MTHPDDPEEVYTPFGILYVILEDHEQAIACLEALEQYASGFRMGNNQAAVIIFTQDGAEFGVTDLWDGDEELQ